ncbi:16S rRNA (cytosine(967)-C(5))-methyltransferase RsmB [Desulfuribacillus alkaliarsenatis]|uniref:16S rRNA (cytosine(967)-C(5))-methyltransferase n=1 Tax=Desulfuribacillus alkaliarsenatis TaxID=766136 RepID=A0A1E5G5S9_9FIRM|nr:16S rRNA (cytosine(967)-C(5))-methyltransferase RsmB [Desulfuribacillus alkaliarsenatis]OEF98536.1 16S rRNA (cytosine(967)-C(5))-methyltransferase [Desulfuribacillus alkaliarsenatis]
MKQSKQQTNKPANARELAVTILVKLEEQDGFSNLLLNHELNNTNLDARDKGLVTEIVYGTIQRQNTIDHVINAFLKKRTVKQLDPWLRQLLRISVYQLRYLDKIPNRAVAYEAVELAKKLGHQGIASFVNGVVRNIIRSPEAPITPEISKDKIEHLSLKHSLPSWLIKKWMEDLGEDKLTDMLTVINNPPPFTIRYNPLKTNKQSFEQSLDKLQIKWQNSSYLEEAYIIQGVGNVSKLEIFNSGLFTVQDESSMLVARVLNPFPTATVLDACAAPGGKTTHIAELQGDKGQITANEIHPHKVKLIEQLTHRLGIKSVNKNIGDFLNYDKNCKYDFVLLDAPCSGLGVIRRKPELKWRMTQTAIDSLVELQKRLIRHAGSFVKPGGSLIYSTCTINRAENNSVVEDFLADNKDFQGQSIQELLPQELHKHMHNEYSVQVLPNYMNSDGFYIAKLEKN